jgi:hypothetical protein
MTENSAGFSGDIPKNYDRDLGQIIFAGYAADMAQRAVSGGTALAFWKRRQAAAF